MWSVSLSPFSRTSSWNLFGSVSLSWVSEEYFPSAAANCFYRRDTPCPAALAGILYSKEKRSTSASSANACLLEPGATASLTQCQMLCLVSSWRVACILTLEVTTVGSLGNVFSKLRHTFSSMLGLILRLPSKNLIWKCSRLHRQPCLPAVGRHCPEQHSHKIWLSWNVFQAMESLFVEWELCKDVSHLQELWADVIWIPGVPLPCNMLVIRCLFSQAVVQCPMFAVHNTFVQTHPWWSSIAIRAVRSELSDTIAYMLLLFSWGTAEEQWSKEKLSNWFWPWFSLVLNSSDSTHCMRINHGWIAQNQVCVLFCWGSEPTVMSYFELRKIDKCRIIYICNHYNHITSNSSVLCS